MPSTLPTSDHMAPDVLPTDAAESTRARILVFVVAYEAEEHLRDVFERVPAEWLHRDDVHFLCIDDASTDGGADLLGQWLTEHDVANVTVLKNRSNQGYGGNQKLGYRIAVDGGYDFVILLHGDGQYAPELLPEFERQWRDHDADVVLGTRMHSVKSARDGGMPWYKLAGNRLLTSLQNGLTGLGLSEFHTGYRGYSTRFLAEIPFELNTDDFHFDTEILLQADNLAARIVEIPIPTRYADEVCRVNGIRYAWNVVRATVGYRLHRMGMFCSLLYRNGSVDRYRDKSDAIDSSHARALRIVERARPGRVLDIGCGTGHVARECRERVGATVIGVDRGECDPANVDRFHRVDLETDPVPVDVFEQDVVLLLDVIEHLAEPERFLLSLRHAARSDRPAPLFVVSTPNVAFAAVRLNLLLGRFTYAERGILDITHKRLFTRRSLVAALESCGYVVQRVHAVGPPFESVLSGRLGRCLGVLGSWMARIWSGLFAFQFVVECEPRPGVQQVLGAASRVREAEHRPVPVAHSSSANREAATTS